MVKITRLSPAEVPMNGRYSILFEGTKCQILITSSTARLKRTHIANGQFAGNVALRHEDQRRVMEGLVDHARPSVKVEKNRRALAMRSGAKQGRYRL